MRNFETSDTSCSHIWHKYRPVILRLMVDAANAPQEYIFSAHEFRRMFPKGRSLSFTLYIHQSKALNRINTSPLAIALLKVLQQSGTVAKLTEHSTYELMLDEKFVFHVRRNEVVPDDTVTSGTNLLSGSGAASD